MKTDEHMNKFEKFDEIRFSKRGDFYSLLRDEHLNGEDYEHIRNVWNEFQIHLFEQFRKICL